MECFNMVPFGLTGVGGQSGGDSPGPLHGSSKDVLELPGQSSNFNFAMESDLQESTSLAQH